LQGENVIWAEFFFIKKINQPADTAKDTCPGKLKLIGGGTVLCPNESRVKFEGEKVI
jgi:hypothetical protein